MRRLVVVAGAMAVVSAAGYWWYSLPSQRNPEDGGEGTETPPESAGETVDVEDGFQWPRQPEAYRWEPGMKVLLCGEADFTFSLAWLAEKETEEGAEVARAQAECMTATCHAPQPNPDRYKKAEANASALAAKGAHVIWGVDATRLEDMEEVASRGPYDRVIFNFPHIPSKTQIQRNRELLGGFLEAAEKVLAPGGAVVVALARGQSGIPADAPRLVGNHWQLEALAAEASLTLMHSEAFPRRWEPFGYHPKGRRGYDAQFPSAGAMFHVLQRRTPAATTTVSWETLCGVGHAGSLALLPVVHPFALALAFLASQGVVAEPLLIPERAQFTRDEREELPVFWLYPCTRYVARLCEDTRETAQKAVEMLVPSSCAVGSLVGRPVVDLAVLLTEIARERDIVLDTRLLQCRDARFWMWGADPIREMCARGELADALEAAVMLLSRARLVDSWSGYRLLTFHICVRMETSDLERETERFLEAMRDLAEGMCVKVAMRDRFLRDDGVETMSWRCSYASAGVPFSREECLEVHRRLEALLGA